MIIFSFFSIVSVAMITCFSIALLNVVIRRESAFLIEERIKVIVESRKGIIDPVLNRIDGCEYASNAALFSLFTEHLNASWPGSQTVVGMLPLEVPPGVNPPWLHAPNFTGIVEDHGKLEIRFLRMVKRNGCLVRVVVRVPLGEAYLGQSAAASGLVVVDSQPVMLPRYRHKEGLAGEIEANFVPGSWRPIPVVVVARDWQSGSVESWVICQIRPSYSRTIEDLSRMGLRTASWVFPLLISGSGLCRELRIMLSNGSAIVVYSDGLIDALNSKDEEFGEERLVSCYKLLPLGASAESICTSLSHHVAEWSAGAEQFDDITILVLAVD